MTELQLDVGLFGVIRRRPIHIDLARSIGIGIADIVFSWEKRRAVQRIEAQSGVICLPSRGAILAQVSLCNRVKPTNAADQRAGNAPGGIGILVLRGAW